MSIKEAVVSALKELVLPELAELRTGLTLTNQRLDDTRARLDDLGKRLDDVNAHLVDQSRRIDALGGRIDAVREELGARIDALDGRLDDTNKRLDRLYEVIVRRDEHYQLAGRLERLEVEVAELKRRLAA